MISLHVALLPQLLDRAFLTGSHAVVVDALRATTTIIAALEAGAADVFPCRTIDEALTRAGKFTPGEVLLAGERGGRPIAGFDLGNSPAEFTAARVAGQHLVMTTTNGTLALLECTTARRILVGAFANLTAVCQSLLDAPDKTKIAIVCAGTDGRITGEDVLFAGAVVEQLETPVDCELDDSAVIARAAWLAVRKQLSGRELTAALAEALRSCAGGRNLVEIGMADDIDWTAQIDRFARVPVFDAATGRVVVPASQPEA